MRELVQHEGALGEMSDVEASRGRRIVIAMGQAMRTNPALQNCSLESIKACAYKVAALDMDCSGVSGDVWLVPIGGKMEVWFGVEGYRKLAYRSGLVAAVAMDTVYEGDEFRFTASDTVEPIHHEAKGLSNKVVAHWAMLELFSGRKLATVLWKKDFDALTAAGKAKGGNNPWHKFPDRMLALVPLRRVIRKGPKSLVQLPMHMMLTDDGEVVRQPRMGRDAAEVVAETNLLTSDQGDEVES